MNVLVFSLWQLPLAVTTQGFALPSQMLSNMIQSSKDYYLDEKKQDFPTVFDPIFVTSMVFASSTLTTLSFCVPLNEFLDRSLPITETLQR